MIRFYDILRFLGKNLAKTFTKKSKNLQDRPKKFKKSQKSQDSYQEFQEKPNRQENARGFEIPV